MSPRKSPNQVVYLAGPISGCNESQIHAWRDRIQHDFGNEFAFLDPSAPDHLLGEDSRGASEIVRRDEAAIRRADGVLANMWKESIGTTLGIAYARTKGVPVVIADPNHLQSRMLAHYADAVENRVRQAMKALRAILRAHRNVRTVIKSGGAEEAFQRRKLVRSVRNAVRAAGRDDILAPAAIVPRVYDLLAGARAPAKGKVTSKAIKEAVWTVLRDLEADPRRHNAFAGARLAWERFDHDRRRSVLRRRRPPTPAAVRPKSLAVPVRSGKAHATIWGKTVRTLSDIHAPARYLFQQICRVEGIAGIRLTRMADGPDVPGVKAEILASKNPGIIEGKCFTRGLKGRIQMFQIRVHDHERTEAIRRTLMDHLGSVNLLRMEEEAG